MLFLINVADSREIAHPKQSLPHRLGWGHVNRRARSGECDSKNHCILLDENNFDLLRFETWGPRQLAVLRRGLIVHASVMFPEYHRNIFSSRKHKPLKSQGRLRSGLWFKSHASLSTGAWQKD